MLGDLVSAVFVVGLPVFVLSWFLFQRMFERGTLDRSLTGDDFNKHVSSVGKSLKEQKGLESRWIGLGGGFYGIGALWTLLVVEIKDIATFLYEFEGVSALLEDGIVGLIVDFFINQLQNFITAITWFLYWGEGSAIAIFLVVAWGAYYAGVRLARTLSATELKAWIADLVENQ